MPSFSSPLFWQIHMLVSNLSKKNFKPSLAEINQLVDLYGSDARLFFFTCLLLELDTFLRESKVQTNPTQTHKLLTTELVGLTGKPNFVSQICTAFEYVAAGEAKGVGRAASGINEEYLANFSRHLKLPTEQQVCLFLALAHSVLPVLSSEAVKALKARVPDLAPGACAPLPPVALHTLLTLLTTHEVFIAVPKVQAQCLAALKALHPQATSSVFFAPTVAAPVSVDFAKSVTPSVSLGLAVASGVDVAKAVVELGYGATASSGAFRETLAMFGFGSGDGLSKLPSSIIAQLFILMAKTQEGLTDSFIPLMSEKNASSSSSRSSWEIDVVLDVLKADHSPIDWPGVVSGLDCPAADFSRSDAFHFVVRAVKAGSAKPFPPKSLLTSWANARAQLQALKHASAAAPDSVTFASAGTLFAPVEGSGRVWGSANQAWCCVEVYYALCRLAYLHGLATEMYEVLYEPRTYAPELVLLGLFHVRKLHPEYADRDPILQRMLSDLIGEFFDAALDVDPRAPSPVIAPIVLRRLWDIDPALCLRTMAGRANVTASYAGPGSLLPLIGLVGELSGIAAAVADFGCRSDDVRVAVDLAAYLPPSAYSDAYKIDNLLLELLNARGNQAALTYIEFLRDAATSQQSANKANGATTTPPPRAEFVQAVSRALKASDLQFVVTMTREVDSAIEACCAAYPALQSASTQEVEEQANKYFQQIYTSQQTIDEVIDMLRRFKNSPNAHEREIFSCMIHNLFDEYRFFHKYPEKELRITGELFGTIIQNQLVSGPSLGIALRYVLDALRKVPNSTPNSKIFRFGMFALEQFKSRLSKWPQYCANIVQIPHLREQAPQLVAEVTAVLQSLGDAGALPADVSTTGPGVASGLEPAESVASIADVRVDEPAVGRQSPVETALPAGAPQVPATVAVTTVEPVLSSVGGPPAPGAPSGGPVAVSMRDTVMAAIEPEMASILLALSMGTVIPTAAGRGGEAATGGFGVGPTTVVAGKPLPVARECPRPPDNVVDMFHLVLNNVTEANVDEFSGRLRPMLRAEFVPWFSNYLVSTRVATQPNFQAVFRSLIDRLGVVQVQEEVLQWTYDNIKKLLVSDKIRTSAQERSLLKNLGSWLGKITLARNKPVLHRDLDMKELLFEAYESGRLIACVAFVAKVMEGISESRVFKPPNPWTMGMLNALRELYDVPEIKLNLRFEVELMCKQLAIDVKDLVPGRLLHARKRPVLSGNPDFNVKVPEPIVPGIAPQQESSETSAVVDLTALPAVVIPKLAAFSVVPPHAAFDRMPLLKGIVAVALDRAVRDVIQPVVERSATIACTTARDLVIKDFATDPDPSKFATAAHLIVSSLCGSLTQVTCQDLLRSSVTSHVRTLLASTDLDAAVVGEIADSIVDANLELCSALLERAAMDRAVREIDDSLASQITQRRHHFDSGIGLDPSLTFAPVSQWTRSLPSMLQPRPGGLTADQLMVYEAFNRLPRMVSPILTSAPAPGGVPPMNAGPRGAPPAGAMGAPNARGGLTVNTALEEYQLLTEKLEAAVTAVVSSAGRNVALGSLGPDHVILALLQAVRRVADRVVPEQREVAASTFGKKVFKYWYDSGVDGLASQMYLSLLSSAREVAKTLPRDLTAMVAVGAEGPTAKLGGDVIVSLLSVTPPLLSLPELDQLFVKLMDGGRAVPVVNIVASILQRVMLPSARGDRPPLVHPSSMQATYSLLSKIAASRTPALPQLPSVMEAIRQAAIKSDAAKPVSGPAPFPSIATEAERSQVLVLLENWVRIWHESQLSPQAAMAEKYRSFLLVLQQQGVLSSEAQIEKFFRIMMELCVQSAVASARPAPAGSSEGPLASMPHTTVLTYTGVDALSKLVALLVQVIGESTQAKMTTLNRALTAVTRTLVSDADAAAATPSEDGSFGGRFDQRPYLRLFTNLLQDLRLHETSPEAATFNFQILHNFVTVLHAIKPSRLPLFAFSWLELASHRFLMPKLLSAPNQQGWGLVQRLVTDLLRFLMPYLQRGEMADSIRLMYRGTLRVLLVLLHDFPDFLCEYHYVLCDAIPTSCIQLRNLVLSAFPRQMRLPDPFATNVKLDALPELAQAPRILGSPAAALTSLMPEIEGFLKTRRAALIPAIKARLMHAPDVAPFADSPYNTQLVNALALYAGSYAVSQLADVTGLSPTPAPTGAYLTSASVEMLMLLLKDMDVDGRYALLNAMANQLRYPNSHTYFFSATVLHVFLECHDDSIKEQVSRVLLERLIVHRPHPWGLLVTFMDLIKNPRYDFWNHPFTRCAPEIHRLLESVARSCSGGATGDRAAVESDLAGFSALAVADR